MNQKITQTCRVEKNKDFFQTKTFFYPKPLLIVFCVLVCLLLTSGNVAADDTLTISNDGKKVILKNRYLKITVPGFYLQVTTEDGTKYAIGNNLRIAVESIVELVNTEKEKYIELKSKKFSRGKNKDKYEFLVRLKLRADSPVLEVESELKNLENTTVNGYYFWKINPAYSNVYFSKGQFIVDAPGHLNVEDWGYFPASKDKTGFGLAGDTGQSGFFLYTIYPRNIWKKMGWYICKKNSKLPKGQSSSINFIFVPTKSLEKFQEVYQSISKKNNTE